MTSAIQAIERPIPMSGPMVKAILNGRKTQARMVVNPEPETYQGETGLQFEWPNWHGSLSADGFARYCPQGQPGDRLWVRETFLMDDRVNPGRVPQEVIYAATPEWALDHTGAYVRVTYLDRSPVPPEAAATSIATNKHWHKKPSMHMPRWASRITLEITAVRVERLQQIDEGDANAEGSLNWINDLDGRSYDNAVSQWCRWSKRIDPEVTTATARGAFATLWNSINGKRPGCSWESNPWVWAISFKRLLPGT